MTKKRKKYKNSKMPSKGQFLEVCKNSRSREEIGKKLGIAVSTVSKYAAIFDVSLRELWKGSVLEPSEIVQEVILEYIRSHSVAKICVKMRMGHPRLVRILRDAGFSIPNVGGKMTQIQRHFNGKHWLPISKELSAILTGLLMGDGHLNCSDNLLTYKWDSSLEEYRNALNTSNYLLDSFNSLELNEIIEKYNKAGEFFSAARGAVLKFHKSVLEEPWIRLLAQQFQTCGFSVEIPPPSKNKIRMNTHKTVQLYKLLLSWYPDGKKHLPPNLTLTPLSLLCWHVGDGSATKNRVKLSTHSFSLAENYSLVRLLKKSLGIKTKIRPHNKNTTTYYYLDITGQENINEYFEYIRDLNGDSRNLLSLAEKLFPWKFDCNLKKEDVVPKRTNWKEKIKDPAIKRRSHEYVQTFIDLLRRFGVEPSDRTEQLEYLFPWVSLIQASKK
ncbi:MAG: LAGLIDADG family homing endonuclease [Promethearchaeota archaeon]